MHFQKRQCIPALTEPAWSSLRSLRRGRCGERDNVGNHLRHNMPSSKLGVKLAR